MTRDRILAFIQTCDHSPTVREIGRAMGGLSPSTVHAHLAWLERAGLIRRVGEQRRIYPVAA